jgi:hypothetical protein
MGRHWGLLKEMQMEHRLDWQMEKHWVLQKDQQKD